MPPMVRTMLHCQCDSLERTTLARPVPQHPASFIADTEANKGAELCRFIKDEFDAFMKCAIQAHGFHRLRCRGCGHDKLQTLSRKRRGFCPSCGARRKSQAPATWWIASSRM